MEEDCYLILLDDSGNLIENTNIKKPKTYNELLSYIKNGFKKLPKDYEIYYTKDTENVIIDSNEKYKLSNDTIFIREIFKLDASKSKFTFFYEQLPESKQEILDEKYGCTICQENIRGKNNEKPLLCYQCQKLFHRKCLEDWDKKCKMQNVNFSCPKCKYELPFKNWKEKVNYAEERDNEFIMVDELSKNKPKENEKININNYITYAKSTSQIFKNILNIINEMVFLINNNVGKKEFNNPEEIVGEIFQGLMVIESFVKNKINNNYEIVVINNKNDIKDIKNINMRRAYIKPSSNIKLNDKRNNYITAEIEARKNNEVLRIINSYEEFYKNKNDSFLKKGSKNEKEIIDNVEIYINEKKIPFSYTYYFGMKGKYTITYKFKKPLENINYMFSKCNRLTKIDFSNFNSEKIINIIYLFLDCQSLIDIDLSNFNTKEITNMSNIFVHCLSLTNLNLSSFNTEKVIDMNGMFYECRSLRNLDLSNFNTKKVTNMSSMFSQCKSLVNVNLSSFNTEKVIEMHSMFSYCLSLENLDLSTFKVKIVSTMSEMFSNCRSLKNLNLSGFNTKYRFIVMKDLFFNCLSLKQENIITNDKKILRELKI
jgi:surface protein